MTCLSVEVMAVRCRGMVQFCWEKWDASSCALDGSILSLASTPLPALTGFPDSHSWTMN